MRLVAALALAFLLPGCALFESEGAETLVLSNADSQALQVILSIEQLEGGLLVFSDQVFLERGATREYALEMRPGQHLASLTTSSGAQERLGIDIPERGDTRIELRAHRGGATLTVTH